MNTQIDTSEIVLEEIYSAALPSLDDLMKEFEAQEANGSNEIEIANGAALVEEPPAAPQLNAENLERENRELTAQLARAQADFESFRRRTERERGEHYAFAVASIVKELLPVLDNFRLALKSADASSATEEVRNFADGFELISQQLEKVLQTLGVEPIAAIGETFDPHFHEAVATEADANHAPNTILAELVRGYRLGDKLIRPAMVKVSV